MAFRRSERHMAIAAQVAEALPLQGLAQAVALPGIEFAHDQDQAPAAIPDRRVGRIDVA